VSRDGSKTIKIIHTGDFHIGATYGRLRGRKIEEIRREDIKKNVSKIVDDAIREKVDIFLISGDIFHFSTPKGLDFVFFSEQVGRLARNGIITIAIAGNHDKPKVRTVENHLKGLVRANAPNFYYVQEIPRGPIIIELKDKDMKVGIVPIPYIDPRIVREVGDKYFNFIRRNIGDLLDKKNFVNMDFKVLMAHVIMSGARVKDIPGLYLNDPKVGREDLCAREFDYVALGHIHQAQKVDRNIYYSGSVERLSFAEVDEDKYYVMVEYDGKSGAIDISLRELETRPMRILEVKEIKTVIDPLSDIKEVLRNKGIEDGSVIRLKISGESAAISTLKKRLHLLERYLIDELGVAGYDVQFSTKAIISDIKKKHRDLRQGFSAIIQEYIKNLNIDEEIKSRAIKHAIEILKEVE